MIHVRAVEPRDKYCLALTFTDGTTGIANLTDHLAEGPVFRELRRVDLFAQAYVEDGVVEWPNGASLAPEFLYALAHGLPIPEDGTQARANEMQVSLSELRKLAGQNQVGVARSMGMAQSELSRFENREDRLLSTLRRYVEALGGELEVVAILGDKRLTLRGV